MFTVAGVRRRKRKMRLQEWKKARFATALQMCLEGTGEPLKNMEQESGKGGLAF